LDFAAKSDMKFDGHPWITPGAGVGGPILDQYSAAYAVCRVERLVEAGDHAIVVGVVIDGAAREDHHALAYARRKFFTAA
jgi:flavin reductase (DIM6/NTAB) family NADH-FMN oxidoreductase RutF